MTKKVSVVIPTFNRAIFLKEAIESVIRQSFSDFEIIVVDDGSTDNTQEVVKSFGNSVRYYRQDNLGVAKARNFALGKAQGEYVAFLDDDDQWFPFKLETQCGYLLRHPEIDFVFSDFNALFGGYGKIKYSFIRNQYSVFRQHNLSFDKIFKNRELIEKKMENGDRKLESFYWGNIFPFMLLGNFVLNSSLMAKKDLIVSLGGYDEKYKTTNEDYSLFIRMSQKGTGGFVDRPMLNYRITKNSLSRSPAHYVQKWKSAIEIIENALKSEPDLSKSSAGTYNYSLSLFYWEVAYFLDIGKNRAEATYYWKQSLTLNPKSPSAYIGLQFGGWLPFYRMVVTLIKKYILRR